MSRILRSIMYVVLLGICIVSLNACSEDDDPVAVEFGTITGTVTDESGKAIPEVTVTVSGIGEEDQTATTGADGRYTVENVSLKTHAVSFSKVGWLKVGITVTAESFDANRVATADIALIHASSKISGIVTDARNGGAPLAGVTVSIGAAGTATTGEDGKYLLEDLIVEDYTLTFEKANYVTITKQVAAADFVEGVATFDVVMGGEDILRGLTAAELSEADQWYYNEYRGGRNDDAYPRWDWSTDYMSALDFRGAWEEQNEGTTLQIRNNEEDQDNPADLDVFDSYVFGSKLITEDNQILSLRLRTHNADASAPAHFGVQVVDLSAPQPAAIKIGENQTYGSENYTDFEFDLSEFVGKEVIVAIGIYRQSTGNYWKQLVLRAIRFGNQKVEGTDWLPGTEVIPGWKLTQETVRSTMPHTKNHFTGISPESGNRDHYVDAYRSWRDVNHVAAEWCFVPLKKDPEPFAGEGFVIKTNGNASVNTVVPEAYMYAKFAIAAGSNKLTFNTRNFGSNYTYFKLTAIEDNGTVSHIAPASNTAQEASAAEDGCWKFKHGLGGTGNPEEYASFVYELSQFDGQNVTLVIGVYKGGTDSDENKLAFHSIDLN